MVSAKRIIEAKQVYHRIQNHAREIVRQVNHIILEVFISWVENDFYGQQETAFIVIKHQNQNEKYHTDEHHSQWWIDNPLQKFIST